MVEVGRVVLLSELSNLWLLNVMIPSLSGSKVDGGFLGVELHDGSLHVVGGTLVTHQVIFPSVALSQYVPVQFPQVTVVVGRLCGWLGLFINSDHSGGDQLLWCSGHDHLVAFWNVFENVGNLLVL